MFNLSTKSKIFKQAWKMAAQRATIFGGFKGKYFAGCLRAVYLAFRTLINRTKTGYKGGIYQRLELRLTDVSKKIKEFTSLNMKARSGTFESRIAHYENHKLDLLYVMGMIKN